jgi:hypothetical protein
VAVAIASAVHLSKDGGLSMGLQSRDFDSSIAGKNVALAVVFNPSNTLVIGGTSEGQGDTVDGVTDGIIRNSIEKDLARYPELRQKAAAIQRIVIVGDEPISPDNYAQDMVKCYLQGVKNEGWVKPHNLHIFETFLAQVTIYIAYGT